MCSVVWCRVVLVLLVLVLLVLVVLPLLLLLLLLFLIYSYYITSLHHPHLHYHHHYRRHVINDIEDSKRAGFDTHFILPTLSFFEPNSKSNERNNLTPDKYVDTSVGLLVIEQAKERVMYEELMTSVVGFLRRGGVGLNITLLDSGESSLLSSSILSELPGATIGKVVQLTGSLLYVNTALRSIYYYATSGSRGNVSLTATATDSPLECSGDAQHIFRSTQPGDRENVLKFFNTTGELV